MSAITLYNRPSATFDAKVAASIALLQRSAAEHPALTQASSLGAEDMVVTHLLHLAGLPLNVFVLDTGHLHAETLGLLDKLEARYGKAPEVFQPDTEAVVQFVDMLTLMRLRADAAQKRSA